MTCQWCGDDHPVEQLCQRAQRGLTRRSFLFLTTSAVIGATVAPAAQWPWVEVSPMPVQLGRQSIGQLVAEEWNRIIGSDPMDNIFYDRHFQRLIREGLQKRLRPQ